MVDGLAEANSVPSFQHYKSTLEAKEPQQKQNNTKDIQETGKINSQSKLRDLNPFHNIYNDVIRVGGHLQNSNLLYSKKYPMVLLPITPLRNF